MSVIEILTLIYSMLNGKVSYLTRHHLLVKNFKEPFFHMKFRIEKEVKCPNSLIKNI
jgi:hypothetical protein